MHPTWADDVAARNACADQADKNFTDMTNQWHATKREGKGVKVSTREHAQNCR